VKFETQGVLDKFKDSAKKNSLKKRNGLLKSGKIILELV
jgi:hypothetical protein